MSEICSACGILSDPCFCSYSLRTLANEIRRRGYKIKVYETKDVEVDWDY